MSLLFDVLSGLQSGLYVNKPSPTLTYSFKEDLNTARYSYKENYKAPLTFKG